MFSRSFSNLSYFNFLLLTGGCSSRDHERLRHPFFFFEHLRVDDAYEINKFRIVHNKASDKVVPHPAVVELNKKTAIIPINKTKQEISKQWFNLIELDQLHKRIDNDAKLTGNKFSFKCCTKI